MDIQIRYFAELKRLAGVEQETHQAQSAVSADQLYLALRDKHGFAFEASSLRVAVNGRFADWAQELEEGDEVSFLPPFSGG